MYKKVDLEGNYYLEYPNDVWCVYVLDHWFVWSQGSSCGEGFRIHRTDRAPILPEDIKLVERIEYLPYELEMYHKLRNYPIGKSIFVRDELVDL